jgi:D-mannonate dehydratase
MNKWVQILSEQGIREEIEDTKQKIEQKKLERENIGKSWTESHITSHKKYIDKEIEEYKNELIEFQEALEIKMIMNP